MSDPWVTSGTPLQCSCGSVPSPLKVLPIAQVMVGGVLAASIQDFAPVVNVGPFGTCNSLLNPTVASATAAAMGVLTPMPCFGVFPAPWAPGASTTLLGAIPALSSSCTLTCVFGGSVSIATPSCLTVAIS